jgi:hypothetical protein
MLSLVLLLEFTVGSLSQTASIGRSKYNTYLLTVISNTDTFFALLGHASGASVGIRTCGTVLVQVLGTKVLLGFKNPRVIAVV